MNRIKTAIGLFLGVMMFVTVSCENEPVDPLVVTEPVENTIDVVGNYEMTAYNTSDKTDLNNDGTFSTNQMNETVCYLNSSLKLKSDNTFTLTDKGIAIVQDENGVDLLNCFYNPDITGEWELDGNVLSLTYMIGSEEFTKKYTATESTLTQTINNAQVAATNSSNQPIYITSNITKIYSKL